MSSTKVLQKKQLVIISILAFSFLFTFGIKTVLAADNDLLPAIGEMLVAAKENDWQQIEDSLTSFENKWQVVKNTNGPSAEIDESILAIHQSLSSEDQTTIYQSVVLLAKATDTYFSKETQSTVDEKQALKDLNQLLPAITSIKNAVAKEDWQAAQQAYQQLNEAWTEIEMPIRQVNLQVYGNVETKMSLIRVSLYATPPSKQKALKAIEQFEQILVQPTNPNGQVINNDNISLQDLVVLLGLVKEDIAANHTSSAAERMESFIQQWPVVEGQVMTRSKKTYQQVETEMTEILSLLVSEQPDLDKANKMVTSLANKLEPFTEVSKYSAWDAFIILFREGLEALLITAALLAFLRRTGNEEKKPWIWGGLAFGVLLSIGLAFLLTFLFSNVSAGENREVFEGITGLVAVVFMFTVGAWLHKKSNILAWNQYINKKIGVALKGSTPLLLSFVTFIAVVREGAETIIFYMGIASSIDISQLFIGIAAAILFLFVIGFMIIRYSTKLPIRPFFLVATILIYYIAFKFLGISIHALQITDHFTIHSTSLIPSVSWLGIYPTWESTAAQIGLLALILIQFIRTERKKATLRKEV